ncbi:hypothetical protein QVD17_41923 [Tagetes erecta]|uniref:CLIP1 zinc knuckle domain-containing protein n=1 Tax=Tagetes erecta TaxID=13708 RepID=A0AAD8JRH5_TARER|nr:hypothetical protein QVD17_41923 [Tagetes erecta]
MCTKECFQQVEHYRIYSFKICDKLKMEEQMHKNLKEQHEISDQRITSLEESLKKSEREAMNVKNEAAKSNTHSSNVIKYLQEEITTLKKLSEMVNSENSSLKTKLQEEQEKFKSLQEDHKLCEDRFKSLTQNVDSMLIEKHNLNVQLMELTDKLNISQSDLVLIKEEAEKAKSSEQEREGLVPTGIVGSLSSKEEKTQEFQSKKKKKKVRRKKSKAKKNKTKAASSDSTPQLSSTPKSQDSESPSDSNSDFKSNKFKTPASSSKLQQDSEVKASTAKTSQKQRKKSPFKAHQKYCEICEMYNHMTSECCYNKYCINCQMYNHDTMECYYNKYCSICDMVNHNTQDCFYNKRSTMKPRRYVQRNSSSANSARYVSDFKFSDGDHSSDSWKPRSCDEPHRELLCCGTHRPEVSHEVSFELQGAAKDSQRWNKKSPKCGPSPIKFQNGIQKIPKGNNRKKKNSKKEFKRSPKVDQIQIEPKFHTEHVSIAEQASTRLEDVPVQA